MARVEVFTMGNCSYCVMAKRLLNQRGIPFEEKFIDRDNDAEWRPLYERSKMRTLPQIFLDGKLIGGFQELAELDREDQLASFK